MLLTYVDESHSRGVYYLGALLCPESEAISLAAALDDVVEQAMWDHGYIGSGAELHGHEILQAKGEWAELKHKVRARIDVYGKALQAVADHDVKIILRGVDRVRLKARYGENADHPHSIALTHLIERVDIYAKGHSELALIIADECEGQEQYQQELRTYRKTGTWGYKARKITTVVDTMHFASSKASRLLQAADLIAFMYHRIQVGSDKDPRAKKASEGLWDRVAPKVHHAGIWVP
ncbi:DUF3800 domain-containing protein [[Kitasatospora] papulosa]|uniref:DUF3800 domain-containing protein n=1 Tax=Streptomyces TaxID=1883 RepID=UPI0004CAF76A|nr:MULTISPECIES: DUF3800 domain-containing protein [unclassified Streptomyces]MDX3184893.1 DUF3800 domain-containing protein [Streptomyces sp. ME02-7008A-1]MDX3305581.1 DUF3800 domain-containing protein [Streptomyces sp. ME02-7008A]